jgi:hypothetical protein
MGLQILGLALPRLSVRMRISHTPRDEMRFERQDGTWVSGEAETYSESIGESRGVVAIKRLLLQQGRICRSPSGHPPMSKFLPKCPRVVPIPANVSDAGAVGPPGFRLYEASKTFRASRTRSWV